MVFVDDAHLLDGGSATLVHQLALTGKATVLLTVQSGQTVPDPVVAPPVDTRCADAETCRP